MDHKNLSLSKRNILNINIKNQKKNIVEELESVSRFMTKIKYSMY
jgi:hypothetical protein